jgi:hypothetical protein
MGFLSGLVGGVTGFLTGGPVGAAVGAVSGFASGGGDKSTGSSSSSSSTSQQTELRPFSAQEQTLYDSAMSSAQAAGKPMTELEKTQLRERIFNASYQPQAQAITQSYQTAGAQNYANAARRGGAFNSSTKDREDLNAASQARDLGSAANTATLNAEQMLLQEQENRRLAVASANDTLNSLWDARLKGSKIVNTSSGRGKTETKSPDTFWQTAASGIGQALTDKDSWWNKRSSGGGATGEAA